MPAVRIQTVQVMNIKTNDHRYSYQRWGTSDGRFLASLPLSSARLDIYRPQRQERSESGPWAEALVQVLRGPRSMVLRILHRTVRETTLHKYHLSPHLSPHIASTAAATRWYRR